MMFSNRFNRFLQTLHAIRCVLPTTAGLALLATGCFTVRETPYPETKLTALPKGCDLKVQIAGFEAAIVSYVPVYGYETVVSPHHYNYWWGPSWHATTVATETLVPQATASRAFRDRAADLLEQSGYTLQAANPTYRIEVTFTGPFNAEGDGWCSFAWNLFTLFTADQANQTWRAKLKVHDLRTGKLLLVQDYEQFYDVLIWGPIPIFSPNGSDKPRYNTIQCWCLTALTDRTVADATAFLAGLQGAGKEIVK